jgi:hypothetical protein
MSDDNVPGEPTSDDELPRVGMAGTRKRDPKVRNKTLVRERVRGSIRLPEVASDSRRVRRYRGRAVRGAGRALKRQG